MHTPGPWKDASSPDIALHLIADPTGEIIAKVQGVSGEDFDLMIAAPDLLAALKKCLDHLRTTNDLYPIVREAIRKAEGR